MLLLLLSIIGSVFSSIQQEDFLRTQLINDYSSNTRPYTHNSPVIVEPQMHVMHLRQLDYEQMTYQLSAYFRQSWNDPRLLYNETLLPEGHNYITMDKTGKAALWIPDTFFSNGIVHEERSASPSDNDSRGSYHYLRVWPNGDVLYSQMVDLKLHSIMKLEYFPYHIVTLHLFLESYGYSTDDIVFSFDYEGHPITFEERKAAAASTPSFDIVVNDNLSKTSAVSYATGDFALAKMGFRVIPSRVKNILTIVIPITMLVFINGIGFWMNMRYQFNNRINLSITALLADFALTFSLPIPNIGVFMWINMYILISYLFIALSLFCGYIEAKHIGDKLYPNKKIKKKTTPIGEVEMTNINEPQHEEPQEQRETNRVRQSPRLERKPKKGFAKCLELIGLGNYDEDYINRVQNDNSHLLLQPYITPTKRIIRILYYTLWIVITTITLIIGEMHIHANTK